MPAHKLRLSAAFFMRCHRVPYSAVLTSAPAPAIRAVDEGGTPAAPMGGFPQVHVRVSTIDFRLTPEQEAFRSELRTWLDRNAVEVFGEYGAPRFHANDEEWARLMDWHRRLYRAGYVALAWPKEWGGAGAGLVEQIVYQDEMSNRGLPPYGVAMQAITRFGPILMSIGTEAHRRRCQGYSEPNAGSDLASLQTRAVLEGDHFVVNGQKVWTSHAHYSDFQVLLVRTDPDAPKHRGISYLLVDMHSPGITIRPLIQATGEHGFNEVFYDNVHVPRENVVGEINERWK